MLFERFLIPLLSILFACAVDAQAGEVSSAYDANQIKQLQGTLVQAYIHRDVAALDRILADDYTFVTDRGDLTTKQQVLASFGTKGDRTIASYEIADATVRVYGDAAVMVYRYVSHETYRGHDESGNYRVTRIFVRVSGHWRIVAGQETRVALQE